MIEQLIKSLKGDILPEEVLAMLQGELEELIEQVKNSRAAGPLLSGRPG